MTDPIQASSRIPVPPNQTLMGARDPNVINSDRSVKDTDTAVKTSDDDKKKSAFEDYLNKQEITTVKRQKRAVEVDPADEILNASAYSPAGRSAPV